MKAAKQVCSLLLILTFSSLLYFNTFSPVVAYTGIITVQAPTQYYQTGGFNVTGTLGVAPTAGNILIATTSLQNDGTPGYFSSIIQSGVTWTKIVSSNSTPIVNGIYSNFIVSSEIWVGTVGSGASASFTGVVHATALLGYGIMTLAEYSGVSLIVDGYANASAITGTTTSTGTIALTSFAPDLLIGVVSSTGDNTGQTAPQNGFSLTDGVSSSITFWSQAYLSKVLSVTDAANSGTTVDSNAPWAGAIIALKASESVSFTLIGPYYESGQVAPTAVNVTVYYVDGLQESFLLNGTDGIAKIAALNGTLIPDYVSWNTGAYNYTRLYYFGNVSSAAVSIFVSDPSLTSYPYTFTITDYFGMTNPYLETAVKIAGVTTTVERKSLNTVGTVSFIMQQWSSYTLRFVCDEGTYTHTFSAENSFTTSLSMLTGAFPTTTANMPKALATRLNSTAIQVTYTDPDNDTTWIYYTITHDAGTLTVVDYSDNQTATALSTVWNNADNTTDYTVTVKAFKNGVLTTWTIQCEAPTGFTNPFTELMGGFGTWPAGVAANTLPAVALILFAIGIFSYKSAGLACFAGVIFGGVFLYLQWWDIGLSTFGFSIFVAIIVWFTESKKEEPTY